MVPAARAAAWVQGRSGALLVLARKERKATLATLAAAGSGAVLEMPRGWWGLLLPPPSAALTPPCAESAGSCGATPTERTSQARALRMRGLLEHRGPDDRGLSAGDGVALAATRLAIRGPSDAARQPVTDPGTGIVVVCNGEIDNHHALRAWLRDRGRAPAEGSDVAILPALYAERGEAFVEALEGAFALAAWDPRRRTPPPGPRPGGRAPPLLPGDARRRWPSPPSCRPWPPTRARPRALDPEGIAHYLRFGRFPAPTTPVADIRKVGPGEVVRFGPGRTERRRYWRWAVGEVPRRPADPDAFDAVFRGAVARQTECDVRRGVFLSGGVDSSLVAAVTRSLHPSEPLPAYTLRFGEASYDEGAAAREVAERLGLEGEAVWVRPEDFPTKIQALVRLTGEPLADPAWVPTALLAERAARDVKMVLVGEGADEIFGGYPTYLGAVAARAYGRLPAPVRGTFAGLVRRWPPSDRKVTLSFLLKRFVEGDGLGPLERHLLWTSTIPPRVLARLGHPGPSRVFDDPGEGDLLDLLQRHDLETYLAEGLLTKADRASMGWALEPRAPFLDRAVLEFAAGLAPEARVRGLHHQDVPEALRAALPAEVRRAPAEAGPVRAPGRLAPGAPARLGAGAPGGRRPGGGGGRHGRRPGAPGRPRPAAGRPRPRPVDAPGAGGVAGVVGGDRRLGAAVPPDAARPPGGSTPGGPAWPTGRKRALSRPSTAARWGWRRARSRGCRSRASACAG